ncbi:MAG: TRAP transporter large permease [Alphaproteobacteria bacterium]|nr:TRAP transporter large permease [Alphaproteobacteria bacterium]
MSLVFLWVFVATMAIGVPIVFALAFGPLVGFLVDGRTAFLTVIPQRLFVGINVYPLLAIPLFVLAGEIMNVGGITQRLIDFSQKLVGHLRGGLGHVTIVSATIFSGISGSAVADASALGRILIPSMEKEGYHRSYAAAVTAAATVLGPIIPPSIIMVIYAYIMQINVAALFAAGCIPGLIIGIGLMIVNQWVAKRRNYPVADRRATLREMATAFQGAFWALVAPFLILGGILGGIFTPTEAAAAAVLYAALISLIVTRELPLGEVPNILYRTAVISSALLLVVGTAMIFSWVASLSGVTAHLGAFMFAVTDNPYLLLFIINILLFIAGMFLDAGPAILILGPILAPTLTQLGVDPLHFAIVMCVNLSLGLATPPMGLLLFVVSAMSRVSVLAITREMFPFYLVHVAVIFLITYVPEVALWLPRVLGF